LRQGDRVCRASIGNFILDPDAGLDRRYLWRQLEPLRAYSMAVPPPTPEDRFYYRRRTVVAEDRRVERRISFK
jgi:hypothetical protein